MFKAWCALGAMIALAGCVVPQGAMHAGSAGGADKPECRMGSDGQQACGYNCRMGSDGKMACADTPDGTCAMGSNGRVTCSQLAQRGNAPASSRPPECRMGSDGQQVCGYNCRMGSNGRMYCASREDGQCAMNSNGSFTCP